MESQSFPHEVSDWSWETLEALSESNQPENRYLEYKQHLRYPENSSKSETEWRRNIEREFTAFANASGGIIVFGMNDDGETCPFEPPQHEISKTVSQFIQNTTPVVATEVSDPLKVPSDSTNRVSLAVRVHEATRKPVSTSDSAFYLRINDQKHPMGREQIESLFIEADRRQQAIRQLEMEIDRFHEAYRSSFKNASLTENPPDFHLIDVEALRDVLRENNHLYADDSISDIVLKISKQLSEIDSQERYYGRVVNGLVDSFFHDDLESFNRKQQRALREKAIKLHRRLEELAQEVGLDVMND